MNIIDCEQRSPEWFATRRGIPSASSFEKILSPTGKASTQADAYMNQLLAEVMTGEAQGADLSENEWVQRGIELEAEARSWYEFDRGVTVDDVGFVMSHNCGCSPDGIVGTMPIEIKCPAPHTHVGYLLGNKLPTKYIPQVQGQIMICESDCADFISYCPGLAPMVIRVARDDKYIKALQDRLDWFCEQMEAKRQRLIEAGHMESNA